MKFKLENRVRSGFVACFLLLALAFLISILTTNNLLRQIRLVNYNSQILQSLVKFSSAAKDLRSSFRGYILTNHRTAMQQYTTTRHELDSSAGNLQTMLSYNREYVYHLQQTQRLLRKEYALATRGFASYRRNHEVDSTLVAIAEQERLVTDSIIANTTYIQQIEDAELGKKMDKLMYYNDLVKKVNIASLILVITLVSYSLFIYNKENSAKRRADIKTMNYQSQLKRRIIDLKAANEELRTLRGNEKFSATGRVARTIAHEIRNPLTNINLACAHLSTDPELQKYAGLLEVIKGNSDRINQMITDLLNSTRFLELNFSRVSINELLDETLDAARDSLQLKKITTVKDYAQNICDVWVDKEKLKIAIFNIIINAIDAMDEGIGILTLKTAAAGGKCEVSITDNGIGMEEEVLNKLFDPYFTSKTSGTGLGLTNARNIVLNHKGNITVESKPGIGTTFYLMLDFFKEDQTLNKS